MQRTQEGGIIISCDFCATDWDQIKPMIEGHHGSVLCLECLKAALAAMAPGDKPFRCTLCIRENLPADMPCWHHAARPEAMACKECIHQAARAFDRDPDVDWKWQR